MEHTSEIHQQRLDTLCRVCGGRSYRNQINKNRHERYYRCENYSKDILLYFRINVNNDVEGTHSKALCMNCYRRMVNFKTRGASELTLNRSLLLVEKSSQIWTPFQIDKSINECQSCTLFFKHSKGCMKSKKTAQNLIDANTTIESPDTTDSSLDIQLVSQTTDKIEINNQTNDDPITVHEFTHTERVACTISQTDSVPIRSSAQSITPVILPPTDPVSTLAIDCNSRTVTLPNQYNGEIDLTNKQTRAPEIIAELPVDRPTLSTDKIGMNQHIPSLDNVEPSLLITSTSCRKSKASVPMEGDEPNLKLDQKTYEAALLSILEIPVTDTPSNLLEKVGTHIARMKLNNSQERDILRFKTGGQDLVFQRRVVHRKPSNLASSPTKKKRSLQSNRFRKGVGGCSPEDVRAQLASDFKRQPNEVRSHILAKSNVKVVVDTKLALAMKEYLGLSWSQEKKRGRIWSKIGVVIASEHKERKMYKQIVKNKVRIDGMLVNTQTQVGTTKESKAMGLVPDLQRFVFDLLDEYNKTGSLTWHDGGIPTDQIWLKIGGDHGRGSLKMSVQVVNLEKPNSKEHTHIVAMIEAKDTHDVLKQVIMNLDFEIKKLKQLTWNDKHIKIFLFGDYSFLCSVFGLSGANGSFPCLWCLTTKSAIQNVALGPVKDRTLSSIRSCNRRFHASEGNLIQAKMFFNCVRAPLFDIDIEMVVPMYLHILLGIVLKHHNWLVAEAHVIDVLLTEMYAQSATYEDMGLEVFDSYVKALRRREELKELLIDSDLLLVDAESEKEKSI